MAAPTPRVIAECVNTYLARGFVLNVVPVDLFVPTKLGLCREVSCDRFAKYILNTAMQTSGYNRAAGVGLPARDKSEFEGGRNNEYREN